MSEREITLEDLKFEIIDMDERGTTMGAKVLLLPGEYMNMPHNREGEDRDVLIAEVERVDGPALLAVVTNGKMLAVFQLDMLAPADDPYAVWRNQAHNN